jgi:hypothetical protein
MTTKQTCRSELYLKKIRIWIFFFIIALVLSGITAFPLQAELELLAKWLGANSDSIPKNHTGITFWIVTVRNGLQDTYLKYPWLAYGTDWLAFAHIIIAIFFIGVLRDPVKNIWVIQTGMIACALVIPLAFICGGIRGIPLYWRLIDCSFGIIGIIPLWICFRYTRNLRDHL